MNLSTRRLAALSTASLAAAGLAFAGPATAATTPASHNPFGHIDRVTVTTTGATVLGWAADPDNLKLPLAVDLAVDHKVLLKARTALPRPDVAKARDTGPDQGFAATAMLQPGTHTLCVTAINLGAGHNTSLGCRTVVVKAANHDPFGRIDRTTVTTTGATVLGWAADPDNLKLPLAVDLAVDHKVLLKARTGLPRPDVAKKEHTGPDQGFAATAMLKPGTHTLCVTAINLGAGHNTSLGCRTVVVK